VIFISAIDDKTDKLRGFAAGGVDYVVKPVQSEEVLARVETHLSLARLRAKVEAQNDALRNAREELEERVNQRTAELALANERLTASENELQKRLSFERLTAEVSARFVNLPTDQISGEIEDAQRRICELLDVDRSTLWQVSDQDPGTAMMTHVHRHREGPPIPERPSAKEYFPWITQKIMAGETVVLRSVSDLPPEAGSDRGSCDRFGIKAVVVVPFSVGRGPVFGMLTFSLAREERDWPETEVRGFQLVAQVFANALARKAMEKANQDRLQEIEQLKQRLEAENVYLRREIRLQHAHEDIVRRSHAMKNVLAQVEQVAPTDSTVLILGETGTGKELLAQAIHQLSVRKDRMLVTVNCASLPPTLIESELFGREKGAYTGALTRMIGRFETAHESTLFLDEIGELPLDLQSKLLQVLETGRFQRLGSSETTQVNVRIVAATNRDLAREVKEGRFRSDLYYRLNVFPITISPLRDRREDIPLLVWNFVRQFEKRMGKRIDTISQKTMETLMQYSWPGNARELRNVIERAMILSSGKTLEVKIPEVESQEEAEPSRLDDLERRHILNVLARVGWRVAGKGGAAEVLGLKRGTLESKLRKLGINRPRGQVSK
jgi:transcriptional regulator with GAF, ATPase, and Fis domain